MKEDNYFQNEGTRSRDLFIFSSALKDKHESYIDRIPDRYKRKDYIIDKIVVKKKNVK